MLQSADELAYVIAIKVKYDSLRLFRRPDIPPVCKCLDRLWHFIINPLIESGLFLDGDFCILGVARFVASLNMDVLEHDVLHGKARIARDTVDLLHRLRPDVLQTEAVDAREQTLSRRILAPLVINVRDKARNTLDLPGGNHVRNGNVLHERALPVARLDSCHGADPPRHLAVVQ